MSDLETLKYSRTSLSNATNFKVTAAFLFFWQIHIDFCNPTPKKHCMIPQIPKGMESRWYVPPGRTVSTTKVSERRHALHSTATAWKSITGHLDRKKLIQEELDKISAYRKAMKEGSEAMTRNWPDSLEVNILTRWIILYFEHIKNIFQRKRQDKEDAIQLRKDTELEEKTQKYLMLRKEQEEIRDKFIAKAKEALYTTNNEYAKRLNGAVVCAHVLKEREKQLELAEAIKKHQMEEEALYAEKVKRGVIEEQVEKQQQEEIANQKKKELRKFYLNECVTTLRFLWGHFYSSVPKNAKRNPCHCRDT